MENNNSNNNNSNTMIQSISHKMLLMVVPESEKQKVEEELEICKKKLKDSELREISLNAELTRNLLSIKSYIDTEKILREENENLKQKINELEKENKELKIEMNDLKSHVLKLEKIIIENQKYISELEKEKIENQKMLQISQCVADYKEKIWSLIFQKDKSKKQRTYGKDNLKLILNGSKDNELNSKQLEIKNKITENINKIYDIEYFFNSLNDINYERNCMSHPNIKNEYDTLHDEFLNYCNKKWSEEGDEEENVKFTEYIFSVLKS